MRPQSWDQARMLGVCVGAGHPVLVLWFSPRVGPGAQRGLLWLLGASGLS